jgi:hypothetical protein
MPLPWVRMDCQWRTNPKFLILAEDGFHRSIVLYWSVLGWVGSHGQDGFIPYYALAANYGTAKDADALVNVGLWHKMAGGWTVNDWAEYQPSSDESIARSKKARDAAYVRWSKKHPPD